MSISENLSRVRHQIAEACVRAGRSPADVALMAVSKVHTIEAIQEAYAAGQRLFGENRVQEWHAKSPRVKELECLEVHLIGPLQSNKSARAAELFDAVDTVDSLKIAQRLNTACRELGKIIPIHLEIKLSHEATKHGLPPDSLPSFLEDLKSLDHLRPVGLMTVPPWTEDAEESRPYFRTLRLLRDENPSLTQLSMGMSGDFEVAIEEGSTCVRVGTALFGKRSYSDIS